MLASEWARLDVTSEVGLRGRMRWAACKHVNGLLEAVHAHCETQCQPLAVLGLDER